MKLIFTLLLAISTFFCGCMKSYRNEDIASENIAEYHLLWENNKRGPTECGYKILDVTDKGCRIVFSLYGNDGTEDVFIYGLAGYSDRCYKGNVINGNTLVKDAGSYDYITINNAHRKIPAVKIASEDIRDMWVSLYTTN